MGHQNGHSSCFFEISIVTYSVASEDMVLVRLSDARFHQFLDQCDRQRLFDGEVDGPFGCGEVLKLGFELFDYGSGWEQAAVIGKRGEPDEHSFILECRNSVADDFG